MTLWSVNGKLTDDTLQTAGLTTFTVTMLADHPDVFARLRNEVLEILGPNGKVNPQNLREMKYLRAVLNGESCPHRDSSLPLTAISETLRLYPSV